MNRREPLGDLAAILGATNEAARERARLPGVLDVLAATEMFDCAVAMGAKDECKTFVTFDGRGDREKAAGWKSWPFRRLFDTMRLRRIAHPRNKACALAIPFDYDNQRYVVLGVLSAWAYAPSYEAFFEALENFTVPRTLPSIVTPDSIPISPVEPHVVTFGLCPSLHAVVSEVLVRRGWTPQVPTNFSELTRTLESTRADVILVDLDHQPDPMGTLLRVHHCISAETKIVGLGEDMLRAFERQALLDAFVAHDAPESAIFAMLKRFAHQVPELRKTRLRKMTTGIEMALRDTRTPSELSVAGARHAANLMSGWASLHLVSNNGATYASEHPRQRQPVLAALPKAFLSDAPLFQLRADERFYQEISDDRRVVGALERLHPVSAASIPLRQGELRFGTLVSVSRDVPVDSSTFEELDGISKAVSRRFEQFTKNSLLASVERNGVWECVRHGALEFAAYRSRSSAAVWDYRAIDSELGMLVAGDSIDLRAIEALALKQHRLEDELVRFVEKHQEEDRLFVAACDPIGSTISYAARGFPVPLLFDAPGPAGALSSRGAIVRGTVTIVPPAGLLVWDAPLQRWLVRESVEVQSVTETLEDLRPPGLAIVVTRSD